MRKVKSLIKIFRKQGLVGVFHAVSIKVRLFYLRLVYPGVVFNHQDYGDWLRRYEQPLERGRQEYTQLIATLSDSPVITIILVVKTLSIERLLETVNSVVAQLHPKWELFIIFESNSIDPLYSIPEKYFDDDARIRLVPSQSGVKLIDLLNSVLEQSTGTWLTILNAEDLFSAFALYRLVEAINLNPMARLFYSDTDKISYAGNRLDPYFKPDWNQTLFYSQNMIAHSTFYHMDTVRMLGGFSHNIDGAYELDLALRFIEIIQQEQICRIPHVLFHLRTDNNTVTRSLIIPAQDREPGIRALNAHFERQGIKATATYVEPGFRIAYSLPAVLPLVSLIIPTKNGLKLIRECVTSILQKTSYGNYEIIIIDNGSDDPGTLNYFASLVGEPRVRVIRDNSPFNYSALNNSAVKLANGEIIGLINNDIAVITPEWLSEMVSIAMQPGVGIVGAQLWYPDDTLQHGGVILGIGGCAGHAHKGHEKGRTGYFGRMVLMSEFSAVTAACFIVKKEIYERVGGLNETDLQVACNDIDFCLRVRELGYRNVWTPYAELYHFESATRGYEDTPEKKTRLSRESAYIRQKWANYLVNDPAYNPNLTLDSEDYGLAWPPRAH